MTDSPPDPMTRREALRVAAGVALAASFPAALLEAQEERSGMPYRELGSTGQRVSLVGVGGHHIGRCPEQEAVAIVRSALDRGVNFLDNSWDYHDGRSEERMGRALRDGYRAKAFVMTKIDGRDRATAATQIDESLRRLGVEVIDLLQMHEVIRPEDPRWSFEKGGMAAMLAAKEAGKVRFLGFTGHKSPDIHLSMLRACRENGYPLDAVQLPLNVLDAHFESFAGLVLPELVEQGIAPIAMKTMGAGRIVKHGAAKPAECLRYAMNLPVSTVVVGCEKMQYLDEAIETAKAFRPLADAELEALLASTRDAAAGGGLEGYKTSKDFDATSRNPAWLGDVPDLLA